MAIHNLIFDLGGVLLNLDFARTSSAFRALGLHSFDEIYSQAKQAGVFDAFDKGEISSAAFRKELRVHLPEGVTDAQLDAAWNAMLLDLPPERLALLESLRGRYRLFLLSNTNEIHVAAFSAYLQSSFGFPDFSGQFERWYYSCRMGMRKPDAEIFQQVLSENGLKATETLFIDDSIQHVTGAQQAGLHAVWLEPGKTVHTLAEEGVY